MSAATRGQHAANDQERIERCQWPWQEPPKPPEHTASSDPLAPWNGSGTSHSPSTPGWDPSWPSRCPRRASPWSHGASCDCGERTHQTSAAAPLQTAQQASAVCSPCSPGSLGPGRHSRRGPPSLGGSKQRSPVRPTRPAQCIDTDVSLRLDAHHGHAGAGAQLELHGACGPHCLAKRVSLALKMVQQCRALSRD